MSSSEIPAPRQVFIFKDKAVKFPLTGTEKPHRGAISEVKPLCSFEQF